MTYITRLMRFRRMPAVLSSAQPTAADVRRHISVVIGLLSWSLTQDWHEGDDERRIENFRRNLRLIATNEFRSDAHYNQTIDDRNKFLLRLAAELAWVDLNRHRLPDDQRNSFEQSFERYNNTEIDPDADYVEEAVQQDN